MFNENDVDFIVDVAIREMGVHNNSRTRVEILKVINIIFNHKTYWKYYPQRLAEMKQLLENQVLFEDPQSPNS